MKLKLLLFFSIIILLTACSPEPTLETVEITVTQQNYYPLSTRTDLQAVDVVLAALETDDPIEIIKLFRFSTAACRTVGALGGPPPCREGEAEGTPIEVLPVLSSEGTYLRKNETADWQGFDVSAIYAVYEASASAYSDEYYPAGEYGIALIGDGNEPDVTLQVTDGQIVRIDYVLTGYGSTLADNVLNRDVSTFVLPPVSP